MIVRRAQANDIATIQALENEAFGLTWDRATFQKELERPNGFTAVAELEGRTAGAALLVWAADEVQINSFVLGSAWRGRRLSIPFLGALMAWCQKERFSWITLEVKWANRPAVGLYRRFGFVTTACRKQYYADGQDARVMWAGHLSSPRFQRLLKSDSSVEIQNRREL